MEKAIFDTSVWIDLFNNKDSRQVNLLLDYVSENSNLVYLTPTIIQEILQGVKTEADFRQKLNILQSFNSFEPNWKETSIAAAKLYFDLRKKGITIRKSADCIIAQVAIANGIMLVHNDSDFNLIASASALRVFA
jgi:predicted nucleic acid-binding protein